MALIRRGTTADLYRAFQQPENRPVLLKVLQAEHPRRRDVERLEHELSLGQRLHTPLVRRPYALDTFEGRLALVLEDAGGESLDQHLGAPMEIQQFLRLAVQLAAALSEIHQAGIVHRDIKPANLILVPPCQIKVIDFGIATLIPSQQTAAQSPQLLEGALPYMSPEQTGRTNRTLDYRTDLYSLGVTLYEMLTGALPYQARDPLEWVHCHLAQQAAPPEAVVATISKPVSDIVMRLLAKAPEDRYQSARGLELDLKECQSRLRSTGTVAPFHLGQNDTSDKLHIAEKLYGRERPIEALLDAFEQVSQGGRLLVLISGYSGIGKTSLVRELYRPITPRHGILIAGKFDQYQRSTPYSAVAAAFRSLMCQLLSGSEDELRGWRERLLAALGNSGQVLIDVIPEIELILGPQPPVAELGPIESSNRFNRLFRSFIHVFAREAHPLIIFLDDLQWVDSGTLKLVELLMTDVDTRCLLLIGSYRDNEVSPGHPLMATLETLEKEGSSSRSIILEPLRESHIGQWIADSLGSDPAEVALLAQQVAHKTGGNPFFVRQFLSTLHREHLLFFDPVRKRWCWDLPSIECLNITENVGDLLTRKLQTLPPATQSALCFSACIGNRFDLLTLALVCERPLADVQHEIILAVKEGLIDVLASPCGAEIRGGGATAEGQCCQFAHDRVQQAAYDLIEPAQRIPVHLRIGRLLLGRTLTPEQDDRLFEIVGHLNRGREQIVELSERIRLSELNLAAARKARAATAYREALRYLEIGLELLPEDAWQRRYDLALALHESAAEAAYLNGEYARMDCLAAIVLRRARALLDKIRIYEVKVQTFQAQTRLKEAVQTGIDVLRQLGVDLPERPVQADIERGREEINALLRGKAPEDLVGLPEITDPHRKAAMRMFTNITSAVYNAMPELYPLTVFQHVGISIRFGNDHESPMGYATYGLLLCSWGEIELGYQFAEVGMALLARFPSKQTQARTLFVCNYFVRHWKLHLRETLRPLQDAYQLALESGDLEQAGYCLSIRGINSLFVGTALGEVDTQLARDIDALRQIKQNRVLSYDRMFRQVVQSLLGRSADPCRLVGEAYDEDSMRPQHEREDDITSLFFLHYNRLYLCYLFGDHARAAESADAARAHLEGAKSTAIVPLFYFYDSLASLRVLSRGDAAAKEARFARVATNQESMRLWAKHAPMNCQHRYDLVEAERAQRRGEIVAAMELYDRAIWGARDHGYVQEEALAYERAAEFYLALGREEITSAYLAKAWSRYHAWGAPRKLRELEEKHPRWLSSSGAATTLGVRCELLDLATVLKSSQALSQEIVLDRLLSTLMGSVAENAGAQTGFLILCTNGRMRVAAEHSAGKTRVAAGPYAPVVEGQGFSVGVVRYVARTRAPVVLRDGSLPGIFSSDPDIQQRRPKSVLCLAITRQAEVIGVLYLENNLVAGAFTPERLRVLELLAAQAAISLETAELYAALQADRAQLQAIIDNTTAVIYLKDVEFRYLLVNRQFEALFQISKRALVGKTDHDIFPSTVASVFRENDRKALAASAAIESEELAPHADGLHTYLSIKFPLHDASGAVYAVCGISTDITERKRAQWTQYMLAESSRRLSASLDYESTLEQVARLALPELADGGIVYTKDESGRLVAGAIGCDAPALEERLRTMSRSPAVSPDEVAPARALSTGRPAISREGELSCVHLPLRVGERDLGVLTLVALERTQAWGPADLGLLEELSRRAAIALENARLYREAQHAVRLREEFLMATAHELRTPLMPLQLQLQHMDSLLGKGQLEKVHRNLALALQQTKRLHRLVENVLDVSHIQAGRLVLTPEEVDLAQVMRDVAARLADSARRASTEVVLRTSGPVVGRWDRLRLEQVVVNLLGNAIKFGRGKPVGLSVEVRAGKAVLLATDHGPGIGAEDLSRIFERFERAVSANAYSGLGLGLFITRQIVEAHGGSIRAASRPGEGATFTVELPLS